MENQVYPNNNVVIVKLLNGNYVACLYNKDKTKIKDLSSGEVTSLSLETFTMNKYKCNIFWYKSMKAVRDDFYDILYPNSRYGNYEDFDAPTPTWRERMAEKREQKRNEKRVNKLKEILPSYERYDTVTFQEVQNTIYYFIGQDEKNKEQNQRELESRKIKIESEDSIEF